MLKSLSILLVTVLTSFIFTGDKENGYRVIKNTSFVEGEVIEYKAHYGFVNAAEGRMVISEDLFEINGRPCYKIDVFARSLGLLDVFMRIRDNWGTYLDTAAIITHRFHRKIEEGKYKKNEIVNFDHKNKVARVRTFDKKKEEWRPEETFEVPRNVQDLVSGYYYLRTLDFDTLKIGEEITIDSFFDDEVYDFKVKMVGREMVETKLGEIRSVVFNPVMPENDLFKGENSVKIWISDDFNKVPLKIKAEMFVGAVEIDIVSYKSNK